MKILGSILMLAASVVGAGHDHRIPHYKAYQNLIGCKLICNRVKRSSRDKYAPLY